MLVFRSNTVGMKCSGERSGDSVLRSGTAETEAARLRTHFRQEVHRAHAEDTVGGRDGVAAAIDHPFSPPENSPRGQISPLCHPG